MFAAQNGYDKIAAMLINHGADVNLKNNVRGTARPKNKSLACPFLTNTSLALKMSLPCPSPLSLSSCACSVLVSCIIWFVCVFFFLFFFCLCWLCRGSVSQCCAMRVVCMYILLLFRLLFIFVFFIFFIFLLVLVQRGWTALMKAADKGHDKIAALLINHGADVNLKTKVGGTARPKNTV